MTNKAEKKSLLHRHGYLLIFAITILICIAAALLALNIEREQIHKIQQKLGIEIVKPNRIRTLKQATLEIPGQTLTIMLPFALPENKLFRLDDDVKYYVESTKAYVGENEDIAVEIYAITFKSELFPTKWIPNLDSMADTSITSLKRLTGLKNLKSTREQRTVSGYPAIELKSTYILDNQDKMQRVLHIANGFTTWSIRVNYKDTDDLDELATQIIYSALFK